MEARAAGLRGCARVFFLPVVALAGTLAAIAGLQGWVATGPASSVRVPRPVGFRDRVGRFPGQLSLQCDADVVLPGRVDRRRVRRPARCGLHADQSFARRTSASAHQPGGVAGTTTRGRVSLAGGCRRRGRRAGRRGTSGSSTRLSSSTSRVRRRRRREGMTTSISRLRRRRVGWPGTPTTTCSSQWPSVAGRSSAASSGCG